MSGSKELAVLALEGGRTNVQTISQLSETPLWRLLTAVGDSRYAIEQIGESRALRAQAEAHLSSLERFAAAMGDTANGRLEVFDAMQPLIFLFGRPKKHDAELQAWFLVYYKALTPLPRAALDEAVSEYIRTNVGAHMIPQPGVLTKLAEPMSFKLRMAAYRAREALKVKPVRRVTPEERASVQEGLRDLSRRLGGSASLAGQPLARTPHEAAGRYP